MSGRIYGATLGISMLLAGTALAQDYPTHPITLVVPFTAGGPSDAVARLVAHGMSVELGQNVIVQNIAGAGGTIATGQVVNADPDGYTMLFHNIGMSTAPALYPNLSYDPLVDLSHIGLIAEGPIVFAARKDLEPDTFDEFVEYLRERQTDVNWVNAGIGSATYLCSAYLTNALDVEVTSIPYPGFGPALIDLLAGRGDVACDITTSFADHVASGELKAYAIAAPERASTMPDLPTTYELGFPELDTSLWFALYAPSGLPEDVQDRLENALQAALVDDQTREQLIGHGTVVATSEQATSEALKSRLADEIALWTTMLEGVSLE